MEAGLRPFALFLPWARAYVSAACRDGGGGMDERIRHTQASTYSDQQGGLEGGGHNGCQ